MYVHAYVNTCVCTYVYHSVAVDNLQLVNHD